MDRTRAAATERAASYRMHLEAMDVAYRQGRWAAWLALGVNAALGVTKLVAGLLGNSFALVSDAVNSFGDLFTTGGVIIGMRLSAKPADREHPYGHSRIEAIIGLYLSLAVAAAGAWIGYEGLQRMGQSPPVPEWYTLLVAAGVVIVKESLYQYKIRVARRLASQSLMAAAWDHRSDAISSTAVFVGLALARWAGVPWGDTAATLVVAVAILWAGVGLMRASAHELMDRQADMDFLDSVRRAAGLVHGVAALDKLFVRKAGLEYLVDVHVEVDPELNVRRAHDIAHEVQEAIQHALPQVHSILVHIEPHGQVGGSSVQRSEE